MIILTGTDSDKAHKGKVPEIALRRAEEMAGTGVYVVALEVLDDIGRDLPMAGRYGLLTYLDDHYQAPFEYVRYVEENGRRVFEALLAPEGKFLLVVPEEDWVDDRLLVVLDVEAEASVDRGEAVKTCP